MSGTASGTFGDHGITLAAAGRDSAPPTAVQPGVSPHDLVEKGWIATPEGTICREWLHRMYDGTGRLPRITHQSMEFDSHIALVRAGLGIALAPELGRAALPDDVIALEVRDPRPVREVIAVHRRSMSRSPAVLAMLDALRAAG